MLLWCTLLCAAALCLCGAAVHYTVARATQSTQIDNALYTDPGDVALTRERAHALLPPESDGSVESHVPAAEILAEFTYHNQMMERRQRDVSTILARYEAEWPCLWGEEAVGTMATWLKYWNGRHGPEKKDGWKFVCGLRLLQEPCVIYSLGSFGNMAFEAALLAARPQCRIHIFDRDNFDLREWFPKAPARSHVVFHRAFISGADDLKADPPRRTLQGIMAELGHSHIDVLKV